jgi:hypothetical protein
MCAVPCVATLDGIPVNIHERRFKNVHMVESIEEGGE